MTGTDNLTGVMRWFLFQNGNFQKVVETAAERKTRFRQPIWCNVAIAAKCAFLILSVRIADSIREKKFSTSAKKQRKSNSSSDKNEPKGSFFV